MEKNGERYAANGKFYRNYKLLKQTPDKIILQLVK